MFKLCKSYKVYCWKCYKNTLCNSVACYKLESTNSFSLEDRLGKGSSCSHLRHHRQSSRSQVKAQRLHARQHQRSHRIRRRQLRLPKEQTAEDSRQAQHENRLSAHCLCGAFGLRKVDCLSADYALLRPRRRVHSARRHRPARPRPRVAPGTDRIRDAGADSVRDFDSREYETGKKRCLC